MDPEHLKNLKEPEEPEEPELSYEDEQVQMLIQSHLDQEKTLRDADKKRSEDLAHRRFIQEQDDEYQASITKDLERQTDNTDNKVFESPPVEEMRRVRLLRFAD
jgi:hypothetical protein